MNRKRRHIKFCQQNTAMLIVLRENYLCKTSTRHRKNSKESGIVAIDSCFALFGARQYGVTTRDQAPTKKYLRTLILSPDLELSTPTESRHTTCLLEGKSPSVKLMSRKENKELAKTNLKNMDKTKQRLQHIGSIKDLRPKQETHAR